MPHQLCWLLTHQPQLRRSIVCRTWQKFPKVKKKKEKKFSGRTHAVAVVITFFLLSSHVTSHLPILLKFSQSALPFYFVSFFSCFESHNHPLFFFYIMWGALGLWATWHLMWIYYSVLKLETTFWNFKFQLYMLLFVNKNNVFIFIIIISFLLLSSKSFFFISPCLLLLLMLKFKY